MDKSVNYQKFLTEVIDTIFSARYKAYKTVNKYNIEQNFELGRIIVENQQKNNWGKSIVNTLSKDINRLTDGVKGYSPGNLWRMRQFYLEYKDDKELLEFLSAIEYQANFFIGNI